MKKRSALWTLLAAVAIAAVAGCSGEVVKSEETPGGAAAGAGKPSASTSSSQGGQAQQPSATDIGAGSGSGAGTGAAAGAGTGATAGATAGTPTDGAIVAPATAGSGMAGESHPELKTVYFDYDKSDIRAGDAEILRGNLKFLKSGTVRVLIEGHCDERGTNEYNMALGERRANAVKRYMTDLGIDAKRMDVISYGEERPAVRESNEAAWAKNRRAEFKVLK